MKEIDETDMLVKSHRDLEVYRRAFALAMQIFEISQSFPAEEKYSMTDQIRRSSRSVCANIGEAWQKRRYEAAFIAKLSDAGAEAGEVQVWVEFAQSCQYLTERIAGELIADYDELLKTIHAISNHASKWCEQRPATRQRVNHQ